MSTQKIVLEQAEQQVVEALQKELAPTFQQKAWAATSEIFGLLVQESHLDGVFYLLPNGVSVLEFVTAAMGQSNPDNSCSILFNSGQSDALIQATRKVAAGFQNTPSTTEPTWERAPLIRWVIEYSQTPVFPYEFAIVHSNVLNKVTCGMPRPKFVPHVVVQRMVDIPLAYAKKVNWAQIAALPDNHALYKWKNFGQGFEPTTDDWTMLLHYYIHIDFENNQIVKNTRDTYKASVTTLFTGGQAWENRGTLKKSMIENDDYELLEEEFDDTPSARAAAREDQVLSETMDEYQHTEVSLPPAGGMKAAEKKRKKNDSIRCNPLNRAIYLNPTVQSTAVLKMRDIAFAIQGTIDLITANAIPRQEGYKALFALLAGAIYGWMEQLIESKVFQQRPPLDQLPKLGFSPGSNLVLVRPMSTIGRPDAITLNKVPLEEFLANMERYALLYIPSQPYHAIVLHPLLISLMETILAGHPADEPLYTKQDLNHACEILTLGLRRYRPSARAISRGQIVVSFHAYAIKRRLDPVTRYAISGRVNSVYRMHANYALISIRKANEASCSFAAWFIKTIQKHHDTLRAKYSWHSLDLSLPVVKKKANRIPLSAQPYLEGYTGSWSVPQLKWVIPLIQFLTEQSRRKDLPEYNISNWKTLRLATDAAILKVMRDFDVNRLELPHPAQYHLASFMQETKHKYALTERTLVRRVIPPILRKRWFECQEIWSKNYLGGPLITLFNEFGQRIPFNFQAETDRVFRILFSLEKGYRVYGYRHLGSVLHLQFGFPVNFLMHKMAHYGAGHWDNDPVLNIDYYSYDDMDAIVTGQIANFLNITED